jgi:GT2 family glycosyltransferase
MIRVSFVIPVKDDARRLERCLASVSANRYPREAVEVIVADNGSTDGSVGVARAAGARVLSLPGLRVSQLRNRAAAAAAGDILAFVDADHEIAPDWIGSVVDTLADGRVGAVGALCSAPAHGTWVQRMYGALRGRTIGRQDVQWLGAGNLATTRRAFESVGGFDSTLESCEDVDLCQRLRAASWRVIGDERLKNVHLGDPDTLARLFKAERWRGRDNLRVSMRGRLTARDLPSILAPVITVTGCATAIGGVLLWPIFGRGSLLMAGGCCGVVLALSALRALRMVVSAPLRDPVAIGQAFLVALTYELARAGALLTRARHHRVERSPTPSRVPLA